MGAQLKLIQEGKDNMDRQKALEAALAQIDRAFGKGWAMKLGSKETMQVEAVSTGSLGLDTEGRSIPYLASWAQSAPLETIEATAKLIDRLAGRIEDAVEGAAEAADGGP